MEKYKPQKFTDLLSDEVRGSGGKEIPAPPPPPPLSPPPPLFFFFFQSIGLYPLK